MARHITRRGPVLAAQRAVRGGAHLGRAADSKPITNPEDGKDGNTVTLVDEPPSPADVPLDTKFDPEGTPGLMPPEAAPLSESVEKAQGAPEGADDFDKMDYLLPLGEDKLP